MPFSYDQKPQILYLKTKDDEDYFSSNDLDDDDLDDFEEGGTVKSKNIWSKDWSIRNLGGKFVHIKQIKNKIFI